MGLFGDGRAGRVLDGLVAWNNANGLGMQWTRTKDPAGNPALAMSGPQPWFFLIRPKFPSVDLVIGADELGMPPVSFSVGGFESSPASIMKKAVLQMRELSKDFLDGQVEFAWAIIGWTSLTAVSIKEWEIVTDIACEELAAAMTVMYGKEATAEFLAGFQKYPLPESELSRLRARVQQLL